MKKKLMAVLVITMFSLGMAGMANATLVGDFVTAQHYVDDTPWGDPGLAIVEAGAGDTIIMVAPIEYIYEINVEADSIDILIVETGFWDPSVFTGLVVGDLNDSSGDALTGVTVDTNISGWNSSDIYFENDFVAFNWEGLAMNAGEYFNASLEFGPGDPAPVPEPATILLLGAGLLGMTGYGRKRMGKKS